MARRYALPTAPVRRLRWFAVALSTLLLVACTDSGGQPSPQPTPLSPTAAKALRADPIGSLRTVVARASSRPTFAFRVAANMQRQQITGVGRARVGPRSVSKIDILTGDGAWLPVRVLDGTAYVRVPAAYRTAVGRPWVSTSLATPPADTGLSGLAELIRFLQDFDPIRQAEALLAAGTVEVAGEETVAGVRALRYRGVVPASGLAAAAEPNLRAALARRLRVDGVTSVALDLWVDAGYVPRRTRWRAGTTSGTADYSAWGTTVAVTRPASAQTVPLADVLPVFTRER